MEPFRPFVDRAVLKIMPTKFDHEEKMKIVDVLNETIKINGQKHHISSAIHIYTLSVFEALAENDVSKIKNPSYEL